jgi:hypothetical protein
MWVSRACRSMKRSHHLSVLLLYQALEGEKQAIPLRRSHERRRFQIACVVLSLRSPVSAGTGRSAGMYEPSHSKKREIGWSLCSSIPVGDALRAGSLSSLPTSCVQGHSISPAHFALFESRLANEGLIPNCVLVSLRSDAKNYLRSGLFFTCLYRLLYSCYTLPLNGGRLGCTGCTEGSTSSFEPARHSRLGLCPLSILAFQCVLLGNSPSTNLRQQCTSGQSSRPARCRAASGSRSWRIAYLSNPNRVMLSEKRSDVDSKHAPKVLAALRAG